MATLPAIQPLRVPDPLQGYAAVQNILASQQQQQVNALAMEKARRDAEREAALANYLKSANLTTPEGVAGLTRFGKPGLEYQTALGQAETARLTRAKTQADLITSKLTQGRQVFAMAPTPAALADAAKAQFSDPVLGPVLTRMNLTPDSLAAYIAQKSATPEGFAQVKLEFASTADQMVDQLKSQLQRFELGRLLGDETAPATAPVVAPAAAASVAAAAPQELSPLALKQAAEPRPDYYGQGTFAGTAPTAMTAPVGLGVEPVRTDLPAQDMYADLAAVNKLAPPTPIVNAMAAPEAAPGVQVAGPAALPDTDARIADLRQRLRRATIAGNKAAVDVLKGELEDLTKVKTGGPEIFQLQERLDKLPPGSRRRAEIEARIKRLTEEQKGTTVNVGVSTERKYGEQFAGAVAKSDEALWNAAQDAPAQAENANRILSTLATGKAITGPLADVKLNIARALNVVGVDNADTISKTEALVTSMAENTLNAIKTSGLGTGQGFTDKDLKFLQEAKSGNINFQPDTIRQLAELAHRAAEKTAEKWSGRVKQIPKSVLEGTGVSTEPITVPKRASSVTAGARPSGVGPDWTLMTDAAGNKAWVSPDRKQIKEVR